MSADTMTTSVHDYCRVKNALMSLRVHLDVIIPLLSTNENLEISRRLMWDTLRQVKFNSLLNLHYLDHFLMDVILDLVRGILATKPTRPPNNNFGVFQDILNVYNCVQEMEAALILRNSGDKLSRIIQTNYCLSINQEEDHIEMAYFNYRPLAPIPVPGSCFDKINLINQHFQEELIGRSEFQNDSPLMTVFTMVNPSEYLLKLQLENFASKYRYDSVSDPRRFKISLGFVIFILETLGNGIEGSTELIIEMVLGIFQSLSIFDFIRSMPNTELVFLLAYILYFLERIEERVGGCAEITEFKNTVQSIHVLQWKAWHHNINPEVIITYLRFDLTNDVARNLPEVDQLKEESQHLWVEKFTKFPTLEEAIAVHHSDCAICLKDMNLVSDVAVLSGCSHITCLSCTNQWFASKGR